MKWITHKMFFYGFFGDVDVHDEIQWKVFIVGIVCLERPSSILNLQTNTTTILYPDL